MSINTEELSIFSDLSCLTKISDNKNTLPVNDLNKLKDENPNIQIINSKNSNIGSISSNLSSNSSSFISHSINSTSNCSPYKSSSVSTSGLSSVSTSG